MNAKSGATKRNRILIAGILMVFIAALFWFMQQKDPSVKETVVPASRTSIPVSVVTVEADSVRDSFTIVGISKAWRDVEIRSESAGIVRVAPIEVGQHRPAGSLLFRIDDDVASSVLRKARVNQQLAARDVARYTSLHSEGAVAATNLESMRLKLEEAEADLAEAVKHSANTSVRAPFSGLVTSKSVEAGELAQPGMVMANMVDLSRIRINAPVPEKQIARLYVGMPVSVTTDVYPGREFKAVLTSISAKASGGHTYEVESVMQNPPETPFRAGMFARTAFIGEASRSAILIPRRALVGSIRAPEVYVVKNGSVRLRRIVAGQEFSERIEVLSGLEAGEQVVISGQNELGDSMPVTVIGTMKGVSR